MNHLIIRVCEIALASIAGLQAEAKKEFDREIKDIHSRNCAQATAINIEFSEYTRKHELLEHRKQEVLTLMNIAYKKDI